MDLRRGVTLEEIRDLEDIGAWQEERFIRRQKYIDDILEKKNVHKLKESVNKEIIKCHI